MAQFLRPDGLIAAGSWTNNHLAIDEATASDADFAYSQNNPNGTIFEVSLSNPALTPVAGSATVRYRHGQVNAGTLDGTGTATSLSVNLMQGATVIATDAAQAPTGTWTTRAWVIAAATIATITNWNDLRFQFVATGGGGSPAARRGVGVSWAENEAQDGAAAVTHATTGVLTAGTATVVGSAARAAATVTHATSGVLTGQGSSVTGSANRFRAFGTSGVLTGSGSTVTGSANRFRQFTTSGTLTAGTATLTGAATNFTIHATSGVLTGSGSAVTGAAERIVAATTHATTGVLAGQGSAVTGVATNFTIHTTSGILTGQGSTVTGSSARSVGAVTQDLTPSLLTNTEAFFTPVVTVGAVTLTPPLYTNVQTFFTPAVTPSFSEQTLSSGLLENTNTVFGAVISVGTVILGAARFDNDNEFYAPVVFVPEEAFLDAPLFRNSNRFLDHKASSSLRPTRNIFTGGRVRTVASTVGVFS
jgi:hypothetical protein